MVKSRWTAIQIPTEVYDRVHEYVVQNNEKSIADFVSQELKLALDSLEKTKRTGRV